MPCPSKRKSVGLRDTCPALAGGPAIRPLATVTGVGPGAVEPCRDRESTIWQRRFWEHQIRGQEDFNQHVDYIHWDPAKHGHVPRVADESYSTFHRYIHAGIYPENWGGGETPRFNPEHFSE
jgi:REP element-mobilizing transposase RayT